MFGNSVTKMGGAETLKFGAIPIILLAFAGNKAPAFASMTSLRAKGAKNAASTKPQKNPAKTVPRKEKPR